MLNFKIILSIFLQFSLSLSANLDANSKAVTENTEIGSTSKAIHEVVEEFFVKRDIKFDIFVTNENLDLNFNKESSKQTETQSKSEENLPALKNLKSEIDQLLSKFLSISSNFDYRLSTNQFTKSYFEMSKSILFIANKCQSFQDIHYKFMIANKFSQNYKFLTYIHNCPFSILEQNIELFIQHKVLSIRRGLIEDFEVLLINYGQELYLASIEWFSPIACNRPHLKILNTFNKINKKWHQKLTNYRKHQNFYGCELVMLIYNRTGGEKWGSYRINPQTNAVIPFGLVPDIFNLISKRFNFIPSFQPGKIARLVSIFQDSNRVTLVQVNGTMKYPNVCFEVIKFSDNNRVMTQATTSFLEVREVILMTPGELYTPFEKLFLPFDDWTWQLIVVTFLGAFLAIFVINRLPKFFQTTIYGKNVTTPVLNVVSSFFGISQVKLPEKNFPRFILTMFVLFCLIFRTCYQSKLFEFMTSEPRRPPPKTIEDLIDRNYTMYAPLNFAADEDLTESENWPSMQYVDGKSYEKIFATQSQNSTARIALIMQSMILDHYEWMTGESMNWLQIPETSVQVSQIGFSFFANNFFYRGTNEAVQQLIATGIMKKVVENLIGRKRKFSKVSEPRILDLVDLDFGFVIWMWFCGACVAVFLGEVSVWSFRQATKDWVFSKTILNTEAVQNEIEGQESEKISDKTLKNLKAKEK